MIFAGGMKFLLLSAIIYAARHIALRLGTARTEQTLFTPVEWVVFLVAVIGCIVGIHGLATGYITI